MERYGIEVSSVIWTSRLFCPAYTSKSMQYPVFLQILCYHNTVFNVQRLTPVYSWQNLVYDPIPNPLAKSTYQPQYQQHGSLYHSLSLI